MAEEVSEEPGGWPCDPSGSATAPLAPRHSNGPSGLAGLARDRCQRDAVIPDAGVRMWAGTAVDGSPGGAKDPEANGRMRTGSYHRPLREADRVAPPHTELRHGFCCSLGCTTGFALGTYGGLSHNDFCVGLGLLWASFESQILA